MKQTSVEWLESKLDELLELYPSEWEAVGNVIKDAKQMEKVRMIEFAIKFAESDSFYCDGEFDIVKGAVQYYNETYSK